MNTAIVLAALALDTDRALGELNDAAVNVVRDYCRERGYNPNALMTEEALRITEGNLDLEGYKKARRIGSMMRLDRRTRVAVWAVRETRARLAARRAVQAPA